MWLFIVNWTFRINNSNVKICTKYKLFCFQFSPFLSNWKLVLFCLLINLKSSGDTFPIISGLLYTCKVLPCKIYPIHRTSQWHQRKWWILSHESLWPRVPFNDNLGKKSVPKFDTDTGQIIQENIAMQRLNSWQKFSDRLIACEQKVFHMTNKWMFFIQLSHIHSAMPWVTQFDWPLYRHLTGDIWNRCKIIQYI